MNQYMDAREEPERSKGFWRIVESLFDYFSRSWYLISRDKELFIGTLFTIVGLMSFESDKFCDGNTADYLSCTRPSTYYYFDALDIALVVLGVTLLLLWVARSRRSH